MSEVHIVYAVSNYDNTSSTTILNAYSNETEALKECNYWNSQLSKGVVYYTKPIHVMNIFEI